MAKNKIDNDIIPRLYTDLLEFILQVRKTPENFRRPSDEGSATGLGLKWGPLLPNDVSKSHSTSMEREGRKEEKKDTRYYACLKTQNFD